MNEKKVILVPIDFNQKSLVALEQATHIAKILNYEIILLYVLEETGIFSKLLSDSKQEDEILTKLQQKINEISIDTEKKSGIHVKPLIAKGRIPSKILEISEMTFAEMIIMGTNSEPEFKKTIGANTHKIIRWSKCPVITINNIHHYDGCRSILLPLDLTIETRQKVTKSIEIAKAFNATIKVVSALWSKNDTDVIVKLKAQLNQVHNYISERGVKCQSELIESNKNEKSLVPIILRYADDQQDIDLIMIMTQKEVGWIEYFMDSDAQEVIRNSHIPVMSIAPKEIGIIESKGF